MIKFFRILLLAHLILTPHFSSHAATAEYFWNTDPGLGKATPANVSSGPDGLTAGNIQTTVPATPGNHSLYLRSTNADGSWGPTKRVTTYQIRNERPYEPDQLKAGRIKLFDASGAAAFQSGNLIPIRDASPFIAYEDVIPTDLLKLPSGNYTLQLIAEHQNGTSTTRTVPLFLQGQPNQPPVLKFLVPPELTNIKQGDQDSNGTLVSDLLAQLQNPRQAYDPEDDALGIAIQSLNTDLGKWQILPHGTSKWITLEANSRDSATPLNPETRIRLLPHRSLSGTTPKAFTFRLWDQTAGIALTPIVIDSNNGNDSLSQNIGYASLTVTPAPAPPYYTGKTEFNLKNNGSHLALSLPSLFKAESKLVFTLGDISNPDLFGKIAISSRTNELLAYPRENLSGTSTIALTATDTNKQSTTVTLTINLESVNLPPSWSSLPTLKLSEATSTLSLALSKYLNNPESPAESVTYNLRRTLSPLLKEIALDTSTGKFSVTAADGQLGSVALELIATDEAGNSASQKLLVFVSTNPRPKIKDPDFTRATDLKTTLPLPALQTEPETEVGFDFRGDLGASYELQKSDNLINWATESSVTVSDKASVSLSGRLFKTDDRAFWRIIQIERGTPLALSEPIATQNTDAPVGRAHFVIDSTSREAVQSLAYFDGDTPLGNASRGQINSWNFFHEFDLGQPRVAHVYAIADGAEGHQTVSSTLHLLLAAPWQFLALDTAGSPITGRYVEADEDGLLESFRYFPNGTDSLNPVLYFDFPAGAQIIRINGRQHIVFDAASLVLGSATDDPFPLGAGSLPVGPLHFDEIASLLGPAAGDGLPIELWGSQPLIWTGGHLPNTDPLSPTENEEPASFRILSTTPFPDAETPEETEAALRNALSNATPAEDLYRKTWYGSFTFPGTQISFTATREKPLWFTLSPDGSYRLTGAVLVELPNGGTIKGFLRFSHPNYAIQIGAQSVEIPALASLAQTLPENAENCLPNTETPSGAELDHTESCLDAYRRAFQAFALSANKNVFAADAPSPFAAEGFFPTEVDLATSVAEAWGHSLAVQIMNSANETLKPLTGQRLAELLRTQASAATATGDPADIAAMLARLARIQKAISDDVENSFVNLNRDAIDADVQRLAAALERRIQNMDRELTWDQLQRLTRALLDTEGLRALSGSEMSSLAAIANLVLAYAERYQLEIGILIRVDDPDNPGQTIVRARAETDPDPAYESMNRFELLFAVKRLTEIEAASALLGNDANSAIAEAANFVTYSIAFAQNDLARAKATRNGKAMMYAIHDLLQLEALRSSLGSDASSIIADITSELEFVGNELASSLTRRDLITEARFVASIIDQIPAPEIAEAFGAPYYNRLSGILNDLFATFPINPSTSANYTAAETAEIIELGLIRDRLYRSGNFGTYENAFWLNADGETPSRLSRLIAHLAEQAGAIAATSTAPNANAVDRAACVLIDEIALLGREHAAETEASRRADLLERRRQHILHSVSLLDHYRVVALRTWNSGAASLGTQAFLTDLLLPGDIRLQKMAGALSFNVETGFFSGAFSGEVRLPKFDANLTVPNGSFDAAGNIAFTAFGAATFPGAVDGETIQSIRFSVPQRHPLSLELNSSGQVAIGGGARLELPNGMFFEAYFNIDDPDYLFGAEAGGVRFDLADKLRLTLPHVDLDTLAAASGETLLAINAYHSSLARSVAPFVETATSLPPPNFNDIGSPPEYEAPSITLPFDELSAWANTAALNATDATNEAFTSAAVAARGSFVSSISNTLEELRLARSSLVGIEKQLAYIQEANAINATIARGLKDEALRAATGLDDETEIAELTVGAGEVRTLAITVFKGVDPSANSIPLLTAAVTAAMDAEAKYAELGGADSEIAEVTATMESKFEDLSLDLLSRYGIDASTGAVVNQDKFNTLSEPELRYISRLMTRVHAELALLGSADPKGLEIATSLVQIQFNELTRESGPGTPRNETPEQRFKRYLKALDLHGKMSVLGAETSGFELEVASEIEALTAHIKASNPQFDDVRAAAETARTMARIQKEIDSEDAAIERESGLLRIAENSAGRLFAAAKQKKEEKSPLSKVFSLIRAFTENSGNTSANQAAMTSIDAYLVRQIEIIANSDLDAEEIEQVTAFTADALSTLIFAVEFAGLPIEGYEPSFDVFLPALHLDTLTVEFTEVAEARRAYWLIERHVEIIGATLAENTDTLSVAAATALTNSASVALQGSGEILSAFSGHLDALELEDYVLALPGDISLDRIFGEVAFNRLTGVWQVKLGGRVSFPELKDIEGNPAFFEVVDSTFHRDNGFSLQLRGLTPIAFSMGGETVELSVSGGFTLAGSWSGQIDSTQFSAEIRRNEDGEIVSYSADVSYAYNPDTNAHSFGLFVAFTDDISIFGNDLVVFQGGAGTDVTGTETGVVSATLYSNAKVGILNKNTSFPNDYDPEPEDFKLLFIGEVVLGTKADGDVTIGLRSGQLQLPEGFESAACGENLALRPSASSPRASVNVNNLLFTWLADEEAIQLAGSIGLSNVRFGIEEFEQAWMDVCSMSLDFRYDSDTQSSSAAFSDVEAFINLPLPSASDDDAFVRAQLTRGEWAIGGFPTFALSLVTDLHLFEVDPLRVTLLGQNDELVPNTFLAFNEVDGVRSITLSGDVKASIVEMFTTEDGESIDIDGTVGSVLTVTLPNDGSLPDFEDIDWSVSSIEVGTDGQLYMGEPGSGIFIDSPRIAIDNPLGIFASQFEVGFDFGVGLSVAADDGESANDITLSTRGSRIIFNGEAGSPFFLPGEGCYTYGPGDGATAESQNLLGDDAPPFMVRKLCIDFRSPTLESGYISLYPAEGQPLAVFDPANIKMTLSADLNIVDIVTGSVDDLEMTFADGKPTANINGIGFGVDLTETLGLPAAGTVYIGGLKYFPQIFFSGKFTVNFKGNTIEAIGALDANGLRGICFGLAGAEVSIPLPYGFTLNGGQGGIAFGNQIVDPCEFKNAFPIDPATGRPLNVSEAPAFPYPDLTNCPLLTYDELVVLRTANVDTGAVQAEAELAIKRYQAERTLVLTYNMTSADAQEVLADLESGEIDTLLADLAANEVPAESPTDDFVLCPDPSNCPPAALGIGAQPHPEAFVSGSPYEDRAIFKFTSIDEPTLNAFGITFESVSALVDEIGLSPAGFDRTAAQMAHQIVIGVDTIIPRLPDDFAENAAPEIADAADTINEGIEQTLQAIELGFANALICVLEASGSPSSALELYEMIRETAYSGIKYEDVVIKIAGDFSYQGVSMFASVQGGLISSSNGTLGVVGAVKFLGVPVGGAELYLNQYDAYGNPQLPSLCGKLNAKIGPLELGSAALLLDCPGCVEKTFTAVEASFNTLSSQYVYDVMRKIKRSYPDDPTFAPNPSFGPLEHLAMLDTDDKRQAFLQNMIAFPPRDSSGAYATAYLDFITGLANTIIPRIATCGVVQPKLFGFPITGGQEAYGFKGYFGPANTDPERIDEGILLLESFSFAPSKLMLQTLTGNAGGVGELIFPAIDSATATFRSNVAAPGDLMRQALTTEPLTFAEQQTRDVLANSVMTFEYELAPFGLQLGRAGGRILMPSFDHHPQGSNSFFDTRENFDKQLATAGLPSRLEVLLAAMGNDAGSDAPNLLADPEWTGQSPDDFDLIFAETDFEGTFPANTDLTDRFFPHGGVIGASSIAFPKLLTDGLPEQSATLLTPGLTLAEYTEAAQGFFEYVFLTEEVGELAFYIPAPNPPLADFPSNPTALIDSLSAFRPSLDFADYYPAQTMFMQGWADTPILGIPTVSSTINLDGDAGTLDIRSELPTDSWFSALIGQAHLDFSLKPGEEFPESSRFWEAYIDANVDPTSAPDIVSEFVNDLLKGDADLAPAIVDLIQIGPKVSATLSGKDLRIPNPIDLSSSLASVNNASYEAYSPYYDSPDASGDGVMDRIRRNGGIGFAGDLSIGDGLLEIPNAEFSVSFDPGSSIPIVAGSFEVNAIQFGSIFNPSLPNQSYSGTFTAGATSANLSIEASTPRLALNPFLVLNPERDDANGLVDSSINLTANLAANNWGDFRLEIEPSRIALPFVSDTLSLHAHGASEDEAFSFSLTNPWTASAHFEGTGGFELGLPGQDWLTIEPSNPNWTEIASIAISNTGVDISNLPVGTELTFGDDFPIAELRGQSTETRASGTISLNISSDGFALSAFVDNTIAFGSAFTIDTGFTLELSSERVFIEGTVEEIPLGALASIKPTSGDELGISFEKLLSGPLEIRVNPARLDLNSLGLQSVIDINGGSPTTPFSFSNTGPWSAALSLQELTLDPDGPLNVFQPIASAAPSSRSIALAQGTLNGNGLALPSFTATREGNVDFTWFPGQNAREASFDNVDIGTLEVRLGPGGIVVKAQKPVGILDFANFPEMAFPGDLDITPEGFIASLNSTEGFSFPTNATPRLLSIGASDGGTLSLDQDGFKLEVDPPSVSVLGKNILSGDLDTIEFHAGGTKNNLRIQLITTDDVSLFGTGILELREGTHTFSGSLDFDNPPQLAVDLKGRVNLRYPNPSNPTTTLDSSSNIDLEFSAGGVMTPLVLSEQLPEFDLGWLALEKGQITIDYERTVSGRLFTGAFTFAASGWDLDMLGLSFENLGMSVSTNGVITANVGSSATNINLSAIVFDLAQALPFRWDLASGSVGIDIPTSTTVELPNLLAVGGSFKTGLDIPKIEIAADGSFDETFARTLTIGEGGDAFTLASVDVNLRRTSSGTTTLEIDHTLGYELGPNMKYYLRARSNNTFTNRISGQLALPVAIGETFFALSSFDGLDGSIDGKLTFASAELYLDANSAAPTYSGTVNLGGNQFAISISSRQSKSFIKVGPIEVPLPTL